MNCPYNKQIGCAYLDTASMTKSVECQHCVHYDIDKDRIKATGSLPMLKKFLSLFRKKEKYTKPVISVTRPEPEMFKCICRNCGSTFWSSEASFKICPSCYI